MKCPQENNQTQRASTKDYSMLPAYLLRIAILKQLSKSRKWSMVKVEVLRWRYIFKTVLIRYLPFLLHVLLWNYRELSCQFSAVPTNIGSKSSPRDICSLHIDLKLWPACESEGRTEKTLVCNQTKCSLICSGLLSYLVGSGCVSKLYIRKASLKIIWNKDPGLFLVTISPALWPPF